MINEELLLRKYSIELPKDLIEKLQDYGRKRDEDSVYEVISEEEMFELLDFLEGEDGFKDVCPILTDNNSNYIGYFHAEPLKGKLCFMSHEETDLSPGFRNINTLIEQLLSAPDCEWFDLVLDYPEIADNGPASIEDLETVKQIKQVLEAESLDEDYKQQLYFALVSMIPFSCSEELYEYFDSEDMYVQEKAVDVIRKRKYIQATQKLFDVAKNGMYNGRMSAIFALKAFKTQETANMLKELEEILPKGYHVYLRR